MTFFKANFPSLLAWELCLAFAALASGSSSAKASAVNVIGWPLPDLSGEKPNLAIGDDPVYGRQLCPPLTRLNLMQKRSEELLLRRATASGNTWRLELRPNLYWWDGSPVDSRDLAEFVTTELASIVKTRSGGVWAEPKFRVNRADEFSIAVEFSGPPPFGPYIFNGAPFFRKQAGDKEGVSFECAGLYRPRREDFGLALLPNAAYKSNKSLPDLHLYREGVKVPVGPKTMELLYPKELSVSPKERPPGSSSGCARTLDLPFATMVVWNPHLSPTASADFRRTLTQLIPRGALVSAGANTLADVASAPIPRQHPGYNTSIPTRPFDMKAAAGQLSRLGYVRPAASATRLGPDSKPLKLVLLSRTGHGLAEKVIVDAFSAVGIKVIAKTKLSEGEQPDGVLAAFSLDWPRVSFLANLHSRSKSDGTFWPLKDHELDKAMEDYGRSLTTSSPDFSLLGRVHKRLADLEPMTVLVQHKACVVSGPDLRLARGSLNQRDPDWFRELLF